jgi:hypothetical protein
MVFTREDLHNLYLENQEIDKQDRCIKIVEYVKDNVIKSAKSGNKHCKTSIIYQIKDIKDEVLNKLKYLFPESIIEIMPDFEDFYWVSVNWE